MSKVMHLKVSDFPINISALEDALDDACKRVLNIKHRLAIRELAMTLSYSEKWKKKEPNDQGYSDPNRDLSNFKLNLRRRKKTSDQIIISTLMKLAEPARSILLSDIAFIFRDEIDDYTQIDFSNARHVELLKVAIDSSISKVSNKKGRPVNEPLDEFFIGLKTLFENATGKPAVAGAHFDGQPKTDFEKLIYLGYQIIRPAQSYPSALKAYERAISRNS